MPNQQELEYWSEEVSIAFPKMSRSQAQVLALYSYGMAMTQRCGQSIVCVFLALLLGLKSENIRQRMKEFTYEAQQKRGSQRREVDLAAQFEPLAAWVIQQWRDKKKVILGVDVTYLKDRHTILCISVLYAGTAIPIAWKVLEGNTKGEWHPLWLDLLAQIAPRIPKTCQVLLLFDRALYSKPLFNAVRGYNWHPFMRINEQGFYKRDTSKNWQSLKHLVYRGMPQNAFHVQCFKGDTLEAYLWLEWDTEQHEAILLLSDLAPKQVKGNPYPLRMWIEAGFKDWKRGGLHLEHCKIPDPARLERLLLVVAVALLHLIRLGTGALAKALNPSDPQRRLSLLTLGWLHLLVATIHDTPLTEAGFQAYELPAFSSA